MTLTIVSAIALLAVVLFSQPGPSSGSAEKNIARTDTPPVVTAPLQPRAAYPTLESPLGKDADYQVILTFVQGTYQKIPENEAAEITRHLVEYGHRHGVDPKLVAALIARESSFRKEAISATGAKGLGQIKDFNFEALNITDPYDIEQNVCGTVCYLKTMLNSWPSVPESGEKAGLALASYFKGIGAMKRDSGQVDQKTQQYVDDILASYERLLGQHVVASSSVAVAPPEN